jgi:predicted component of type VI protein secretion system
MKLFLVGRSAHADVVIADETVSPYHAEIVVSDGGRCFVTDRNSTKGTFHRVSAEQPWAPLRQGFVGRSEQLRLGDYVCKIGDLLASVAQTALPNETSAPGPTRGSGAAAAGSKGLAPGAVERDPITGEIVRRRL